MTQAPATSAPATSAAPVVGVAIWAKYPGRLADWYSRVLGYSFEERRHEDGRWHWVATGHDVHFEIKGEATPDGFPAPDLPRKAARCGISVQETSYRVADADAAVVAAIEAGGEELLPVEDNDWGRYGTVLDPERNRVGIYEGV